MGCHDRRCRRQCRACTVPPVTAVCFSPDGSRIATASGSAGPLSLGDQRPGAGSASRRSTVHEVLAIAFHPDGTRLALAGDDGVVRFRETAKGTLLGEMLRHEAAVTALAFSPDGRSS